MSSVYKTSFALLSMCMAAGVWTASASEESITLGNCFEDATLISTVQGSGDSVTIPDQQVVVEGIVTGFRSGGFFLQEEPGDSDGNSDTSEGIFVYFSDDATYVPVADGDTARVLGTAKEYYNNSEIELEEMNYCGVSEESITPVTIPMPYVDVLDLETVEGMVASVEDATIFSLDNLTKYGEIFVSDGLKWTPTDVAVPLSEEYEEEDANTTANILYIEDESSSNYPATISFYATDEYDGLNYDNAPRVGDTVSAVGPVNYSYGQYRINPTKETFSLESTRTDKPDLEEGDVTVASFNVLNYFNGEVLDDGSVTFDYDENRGAYSEEEFALQKARIIEALVAMDADVVGLIEIENDGFGEDSAIKDLVDGLNERLGRTIYAYTRPEENSATGADDICNAIIYKKRVVKAKGVLYGIELPTQDKGDETVTMRNSLVQKFKHKGTGKEFAVVVSHFKSKGSTCFEDDNNPSDLDTVQGSCNALRVSAAVALGEALDSMKLSEKILLIGDFNSYSQEDPIAVLTDYSPGTRSYTIQTAVNTSLDDGASAAVTKTYGYVQLKDFYNPEGISYFYYGDDRVGSLDYILANRAASKNVVDMTHWNINSVELYDMQYFNALSYFNPENGDEIDFTAIGPYRSSDHDAVLVSLCLKNRCNKSRKHKQHGPR